MATKQKTKTLVLLDTHAILHRAYHALPDFSSKNGEPTGALYGLASMLLKIIKDLKPDYIAAAYDLPKPTYRHEIYKEYKAGRAKTEDDLVHQIKRSRDLLESFSIPMYDKEGFEADDIIGTIVEQTKNIKDLNVVIASGDMDTLQLVNNDKVRVYTLKKGIKDTIIYNEEAVLERFGFGPALLPDYKGLRGDPSDNIPGIKGVGEKTAGILITEYGSLENVYSAIHQDAFKKIPGISPRIETIIKEGEEEAMFSKELATIRRDAPISFKLGETTWLDEVHTDRILGFFDDLSFRTLGDRVLSLFGASAQVATRQMSFNDVGQDDVLVGDIKKVGIALWLLDSTMSNPTKDDILRFAGTKDFNKAQEYILNEIKEKDLLFIYEKIEEPLIPVLDNMTKIGIKIDKLFLDSLSKQYHNKLHDIDKLIWKYAGVEFNINSPKQLGEVLYDRLSLKAVGLGKTSTGARSTREAELEKLEGQHPIITEIFEYRELQKLLSTYIDAIPSQLGGDGRLHATFVQTGTTTGRLSSQNPNVQNIPTRTELGRAIRSAFVSEEGSLIVALDYSQVELRIAAMLSKDEKLLKIFKNGEDIHRAVASEVFGVAPQDVTKEMRAHAKTINFGMLYGMGINALKKNLGTSQKEAKDFYSKYFERFEGLREYVDRIKRSALKNGYTETFFGRKRFFEGIKSSIPYVRASTERMAINAPIQGTQADLVKIAMIRINEYIKENNKENQVKMLLQVHDELVFEIDEKIATETAKDIKNIMENIISPEDSGGIVFEVDISIGKNWGEMSKITI